MVRQFGPDKSVGYILNFLMILVISAVFSLLTPVNLQRLVCFDELSYISAIPSFVPGHSNAFSALEKFEYHLSVTTRSFDVHLRSFGALILSAAGLKRLQLCVAKFGKSGISRLVVSLTNEGYIT